MKKSMIALVVSASLMICSSYSFALSKNGTTSFNRVDNAGSLLHSSKYNGGPKYAYWHRGRYHRYHRYHRWYPWNRYHHHRYHRYYRW